MGNDVTVSCRADQPGVAGCGGQIIVAGVAFDGAAAIDAAARRLKLPGKVARVVDRVRQFGVEGMAADLQKRLASMEEPLSDADGDVRKAAAGLATAEREHEAARQRRAEASGHRERSRDVADQAVREARQEIESVKDALQRARALQDGLTRQRTDLQRQLADIEALTVFRRLKPRLDAARGALASLEANLGDAKVTWLAEAKEGDDTTDTDRQIAELSIAVAEARDQVNTLHVEVGRSGCAARQAAEQFVQYVTDQAVAEFQAQIDEHKASLAKTVAPSALEVLALAEALDALREQARRLRVDYAALGLADVSGAMGDESVKRAALDAA